MSIIITFITQASLKYLQEAAAILAPQNRIQGRCVTYLSPVHVYLTECVVTLSTARFLDVTCVQPRTHCGHQSVVAQPAHISPSG